MGNGMNKILDGIYIGNISDSKDRTQIDEEKITHILTIINFDCGETFKDIEYLRLNADDVPGQELTQFFPQGIEFIHKARLSGGNVLVHCAAGVSRSVTMVVAYIVMITDLDWHTALNAVRGGRPRAHPNMGFQKQLSDWSTNLEEIKKCKKVLRDLPAVKYNDKEKCKELLVIYERKERERRQRNIPKADDYDIPAGAYKPVKDRFEEDKPAAVLGRGLLGSDEYEPKPMTSAQSNVTCEQKPMTSVQSNATHAEDEKRVGILTALRVILQAKLTNLRNRIKRSTDDHVSREENAQDSSGSSKQ